MSDRIKDSILSKYTPSEVQERTRQANFANHLTDAEQSERMAEIRRVCGEVATGMNWVCPPSRELSLAMAALFWANAAIARNEK